MALRNIGDYLQKDGMLVLVEDVVTVWTTLVWGLTDGWWTFHDVSLRHCSPLMSIEKWKKRYLTRIYRCGELAFGSETVS